MAKAILSGPVKVLLVGATRTPATQRLTCVFEFEPPLTQSEQAWFLRQMTIRPALVIDEQGRVPLLCRIFGHWWKSHYPWQAHCRMCGGVRTPPEGEPEG